MYFGLFRVGKLTESQHIVKVTDIHIADNKNKFLFILRTSKTHDKNVKPQMITVTSSIAKKHAGRGINKNNMTRQPNNVPCPYRRKGGNKAHLLSNFSYSWINHQ